MPSAGDRARVRQIWDSPGVSASGHSSEPGEVDAERLGGDQEEEQAVSIMFQNSTSMGLNEEDEKSGQRPQNRLRGGGNTPSFQE